MPNSGRRWEQMEKVSSHYGSKLRPAVYTPMPLSPERPRQADAIVDRLQQYGATVGAGLGLVESRDDRLRNPVDPEGAVRYTACGHRASACECLEVSRH